ncbi:MAG: polymer-forming cytoskeletal protein [Nitrospirae bacterium]|nr:MAG: polymer-forming cytoskeletal protein [Nitrospirota bacterium]
MSVFRKTDKFDDVAKAAPAAPNREEELRDQFPRTQPHPARSFERPAAVGIGKTVAVEGTVAAEEDLVILGRVKGHVSVAGHTLTVGEGAVIEADVRAHTVVVAGEVHGPVEVEERLEIKAGGVVIGDVKAPSLVIQDGATLKGSVDMDATRQPSAEGKQPKGKGAKPSPFKVAAEQRSSEVAAG